MCSSNTIKKMAILNDALITMFINKFEQSNQTKAILRTSVMENNSILAMRVFIFITTKQTSSAVNEKYRNTYKFLHLKFKVSNIISFLYVMKLRIICMEKEKEYH